MVQPKRYDSKRGHVVTVVEYDDHERQGERVVSLKK